MEAVADRNFLIQWEKTNDSIYEELQSRMDTTILNVMKNYLIEHNVEFDRSIINLKEFKENVVTKLPEAQQIAVTKLEKDIGQELSDMTKALHEGSKTAFSEMAEKLGNFGKSVLKMTARGTAMQAAYLLNPTVGGVVLASSIAAPAIVKGVSSIKKKQEESKQVSVDAFLLKISSRYDENTKEIVYTIPNNIMNMVAENMKAEGVEIDSTDTIKFIRDIAGLDLDKKEIAVKMINNYKGNPYDYEKEVQDLKTKLKNVGQVFKDDIISPISTAAMLGLNIGNSLATWDPDVSASVITALGTGVATGNMALAAGAGATQLGLGKAAQFLPDTVADIVQNANELETMAGATGIALGGALLLKIVPTLVKHGVIATKNYINTKKEENNRKEALTEQEKKELGRKIDRTLLLTAEKIEGKSSREVALGILADTLRSKGIEIDNRITTKAELAKHIKQLKREEIDDVLEVANVIDQVQNEKESQTKQVLSKLAKTAYWGGVIALAGLSAYDAFLNPGFIEGLVTRDTLKLQQTEATLSEQLTSAKEIISDIPQKIKNFPTTIKEAFSDPRGFLEKKRALRENSTNVRNNYGEEIEVAATEQQGEKLEETIRQYQDKISEQQRVEKLLTERKEIAYKDYLDSLQDIRTQLPISEQEALLLKDSKVAKGIYRGSTYGTNAAVPHSNMNDIVINGLNLNTEEGLLTFLENAGKDNKMIQSLMQSTKSKTIEDLVYNSDIRKAIESLGGVNYFEDEHWWNRFFVWKDYRNEIMQLVNEKAESVLGDIPTQSATDEEIIEFLSSFTDTNGKLCDEKMQYYALFQEAQEVGNGGNISELIKKTIRNMDENTQIETELDEVKENIRKLIVEKQQIKKEEAMEKVIQTLENYDEITTMQEVVEETNEGFSQGLKSDITSDPVKIASTGAAVGIAGEATKGIFKKVKAFFKNIFGNNTKALPEAPNNGENKTKNKLMEYIKVEKNTPNIPSDKLQHTKKSKSKER